MKTRATLLLITLPAMLFAQQPIDLLIGTYTNTGKSEGIYVYAFDPATGGATLKSTVSSENPSFLVISADKKYVYAANENGDGKGSVSAYAYDHAAGKLSFLNKQLTQGDHPCHVATDSQGRHVVASNYSGGNLSVFPIEPDGSLGALTQLIQHTGSGPDQNRQQGPHVHSAFFSIDEERIYVQDLGTDHIQIYDYRPENWESPLSPAAQPFASGTPGGGPRHITQSADGGVVYLVQEMTATVKVYRQHEGRLEAIQEVGMNEAGFTGQNGAADIRRSLDGNYLYASNRGDANTLAIYRVDRASGRLTRVGNQSVLGRGPRNFTISPDGKYLLVANQQSDEVVIFARDADTGLLRDTGNRISVGAPVCLVF
ncbi:lactonase family protein [Parapedobacter sp. DT-150]|uniref:lactonase family protein n=1 Tax=Parapedobacter sp. DT-150 TaxID=3396162 RepID=UPI003F1C4E02